MYTTHNLPPQARAIETVAFMLSAELKNLPESLDDAALEALLSSIEEAQAQLSRLKRVAELEWSYRQVGA
ncbi:hypothetical protein [Meiothermus sp. CFH 77666]|uniref:hypothetical protein n=1 Tax=Meiothermus sp. CFH 77666 TaxID=2817942 RepID=UPI001AA02318|nr:hypothetical protein [Meiothermus sp. CFH 77666]MBO1436888.1 hypothetical protein [Meiothermus sp. CFH 77666]